MESLPTPPDINGKKAMRKELQESFPRRLRGLARQWEAFNKNPSEENAWIVQMEHNAFLQYAETFAVLGHEIHELEKAASA